MRIEYDQDADALYIQFKDIRPEDNRDIEDGVTIDLDRDGHLVGLEILDAAKRFGIDSVSKVSVKHEEMPALQRPGGTAAN